MTRVDLLDAPAFTPAYDHALATALTALGAQVRLLTSRFTHGQVPEPIGYERLELFYRGAGRIRSPRARRYLKAAEHGPEMLRYRRRAGREADVVHLQWAPIPALDRFTLPRVPVVVTAHDLLPREPYPGQLRAQASLLRQVDAVIVHSEHGRRTLGEGLSLDPGKLHVIRHGAFDYLTRLPRERPLEPELAAVDGPVVLFFGLVRPYKGIEGLLDAWRGVRGGALWIVGRPMMDLASLRARATASVRFVPRYVGEAEMPALFRRADVVVLPYERTERYDFSGVLATALAFGRPTVVSDVGGFSEVAREGAIELVPPGDPETLRTTLQRLLDDPGERDRLAAAAAAAATGEFSWARAAERTLELYGSVRDGRYVSGPR